MTNEQGMTFEQIVTDLTQLQDAKKRMTERENELKAMLRTLGSGDHTLGENTVRVTPNRRLSAEKVEREFPPEQFPMYYRSVPETAVIKAKIGEDKYKELMEEVGDARVSVL